MKVRLAGEEPAALLSPPLLVGSHPFFSPQGDQAQGKTVYSILPHAKIHIAPAPLASTVKEVAAVKTIPEGKSH